MTRLSKFCHWKVFTKKSMQHLVYAGMGNYDRSVCGLTIYYHDLYVDSKRDKCAKCLKILKVR